MNDDLDAQIASNREQIRINNAKIKRLNARTSALNRERREVEKQIKLANAASRATAPQRTRKKKSTWRPLFRGLVGLARDCRTIRRYNRKKKSKYDVY